MLTIKSDRSYHWTVALLPIGFVVIHWFLQPRIGVRDVDAFAYVVGAFSIASGRCYCDLSGGTLNHWPPAYSFLLSLFSDQLNASVWINHINLLAAVTALYLLLRKGGWERPAALGLCLALGFGFFLDIAGNAAPDIVTYALFLLGILFHQLGSRAGHVTAYLIWGVSVLFKLISVVFIPAAIVFELIQSRFRASRSDLTTWSVGAGIQLAVVFSTLAYNLSTTGQFISPGHPASSINKFPHFAWNLSSGVFRSFLWSWHGTIKTLPVFTLFVITISLALFCLFSLKGQGNQRVWLLGVVVLVMSLGLLFVRYFGTIRLFGYGLLPILAGRKGTDSANVRWLLYGVVAVIVSVFNAKTNNALGANDPRYEQLAKSVAALGPRLQEPIGTNSFHILDIHTKIASQPIQDPDTRIPSPEIREPASRGRIQTIVWVGLPQYGATTVWPMERPSAGWCEIGSVIGATIFRQCDTLNDALE